MGKQILKKTVGALLAVLFLVSLTASAVAACSRTDSCNSADPLSASADPLSALGTGLGTGCDNGCALGDGCDNGCNNGCASGCNSGCDSGCNSGCNSCSACDSGCNSGCDSCSACNSCSACGHGCCCKAKEPTWEDWFNAFKNDGFETWAGFNFANFWSNF